jgi:glycosyltransferase involved in cell wall biosynthesis
VTPKKILYTVENLNVGGLEKVIASIVLGLDRHKYLPEVWCLSKGGKIADELNQQQVDIKILNLTSYYNLLNIIRLARLIKKGRFCVLHAHGYYASTFSRLSALLAGVPIILTHVHSTYFTYNKRNLWIEKFLSFFSDKVICVSRAVQNFVTSVERIREDKTCVIYNGIEPSFADISADDTLQFKSCLGIGDQEIILIVVASLKTLKGHIVLFNAFHKVLKKHLNIKLLVVGEGPLKEELKSRAEEIGIASRIIFTGERDDVSRLLSISDVFVLSSVEREGLSIAIIEAMASGLPVVSTLVGGIPEVVEDGMNGFVVAPNDDGALAEALETLIRDENLRKKMGANGRDTYLRKFTMRKMLLNLETLYDHLLDKKKQCLKYR